MRQWFLHLLKNSRNAILLGIGCALLIIFSNIFPLNIFLLFAGVPVLISYLSYGERDGFISMITTIFMIIIFCKWEIALDMFLTMLLPSAVLGHFSVKNIVDEEKKTWWYPESRLLTHFVLIFGCSLIILSLTIYSEEYMMLAYRHITDIIFGQNTGNRIAFSPYLQKFIKFSVGLSLLLKMIMMAANVQIAQAIAKRFKINIRPGFSISNLTIPNWMAVLPLVLLTIANLCPVLSFVFNGLAVVGLFAPMFSGLSIVHFHADNRKSLLMAMYAILLIFPVPIRRIQG